MADLHPDYEPLRRMIEVEGVPLDEALRRFVGHLDFAFSYPGERESLIAYRRCDQGAENCSIWRLREAPPGDAWFVIGIAERKAPLNKARRLARIAGAVAINAEQMIGTDQLQGLRARRWTNVIEPGIRTMRGQRQTAHFGLGALIDRHGEARPYRRPQG